MPDDAIGRARARAILTERFRAYGYHDQANSIDANSDTALREITVSDIVEIMLAFAQQAPTAHPLPEKRGLEELALLYNHAGDDSRQFTRWQMLAAINHGIRLSAMLDAAPSVTLGEVG